MKDRLINLFLKLLSRLPLSVARLLGRALGSLCWRLNSRETKVTRINLGIAFPGKDSTELEALVKQSMQEWGVTLFEVPVVWGGARRWLDRKIVRQQGAELWDRYRSEGRGLIMLGPHLGNWEVVGLVCSARAGEMTNMFAPTKNIAVDNFIIEARSRFGGIMVPTNKKGVMALIKSLREGGVVGVLPDQVPPQSGGIFSPFFGIPVLTMTLIHNLIKRSGAKALFVFARRVPEGFELIYREPPEALYSENQQQSVDALNQGVEACVREAISQYQWEYKRFRKLPEGAQKIYTKQNLQG